MANRRGYVERDRHGRERVVIERRPSHRRSSSHSHQVTTQELLNDAEERIAELELDNGTLRQQLSFAQSQAWETRGVQTNYQTLQTAYNQLRDEHHHCRHLRGQLEANLREVDRLEDKLDNEEKRNEKLEEKVRLMKRGSGEREQYRRQYEEKSAECELLRRRCAEKDEFVRLGEVRISQKDRTISELRAVLRNYGLRILS